MSKVVIIGSGFSGLSAAAYLSAKGNEVHVFEKNETSGGRARQLKTEEGYVFDMGPSWYWMPDVFEKFFNDFGYNVSDFYDLKLLEPSFDIVFGQNDTMQVPADFEALCNLFESIETGSAVMLKKFMQEAEYKYQVGINNLVYKPGLSIAEFVDLKLIKGALRLQVFTSFSKHVRRYFKHPKLLALMEFPVLFLGAMPQETPALYSLMNYAGLKLGNWYSMGGFGKVAEAMEAVAKKNGVHFHFNSPVQQIIVDDSRVYSIMVDGKEVKCDGIVASADYEHVENKLLQKKDRNYSNAYWDSRTMAPSCLIFYVGINKKIKNIHHHTLFFDEDFLQHSKEIYKTNSWPSNPLFYVCCPSKTDETVAPVGHENLFILMPVTAGLEDTEHIRESYFNKLITRIEKHVGENILDHIDFKKSYCIKDFIIDYNSFKGNAYGLANTLRQTAILKPKVKNKKIANLFYAGQLTVPGPGVPPSLISGKIAANQLINYLKTNLHEAII